MSTNVKSKLSRRSAVHRIKLLTSCCLAVSALSVFAVSASAETPPPSPESPGCKGEIVATFNHNSGIFGASENPNSSAGPGYFLKTATPTAVHGVMEFFCS